MSKVDVIAAEKAKLVAAQDAALDAFGGACYDQAVTDSAGSGGLSQADADAQSAAAVAAAKAQDAQDKADALAAMQSQIDALSKSLADLSAKEALEESTLAGVQDSFAKLQAALAAFSGLFPVPAPVPPAA